MSVWVLAVTLQYDSNNDCFTLLLSAKLRKLNQETYISTEVIDTDFQSPQLFRSLHNQLFLPTNQFQVFPGLLWCTRVTAFLETWKCHRECCKRLRKSREYLIV